jgi:hypothetical protein
MKKIFIYVMLLFLWKASTAQCTVDAGDDLILCVMDLTPFTNDTPRLSASVSNAIEPFLASWSTTIETGLISYPFIYASDLLEDTTSLTPYINTQIYNENNALIIFKVEIIDSIGNSCSDSIVIRFSNFFITMIDYHVYKQADDTTSIYASVAGGIPPVTYSWFPKDNIDTVSNHSCCPRVWPNQNVMYSAIAIDSGGCSIIADPVWFFHILPSSISSLSQSDISIYPNPTSDFVFFKSDRHFQSLQVAIVDNSGKIILSQTVNHNQVDISRLTKGIYSLMLYENEKLLGVEQIVKN